MASNWNYFYLWHFRIFLMTLVVILQLCFQIIFLKHYKSYAIIRGLTRRRLGVVFPSFFLKIHGASRWSKIAKHLPGRTDNEIKNYWRTRIQKHIKQAETFAAQVSSETNEHGSSSSQVSSTTELMVSNCLPPYQGDVEAFSGVNIPQELNENYWSMEDLWSMQLLNGD